MRYRPCQYIALITISAPTQPLNCLRRSVLLCLAGHFLNLVWLIEQPGSSVLNLHVRFQWMLRVLQPWRILVARSFWASFYTPIQASIGPCAAVQEIFPFHQDLQAEFLASQIWPLDPETNNDMVKLSYNPMPRCRKTRQERPCQEGRVRGSLL